jgi:PAS domain S-box-containing protein
MDSPAEDSTGLSRQIAEYRRLEARLRAGEERHRDFALCTAGFEWESDPDGFITYISERATAIIGFLPEEMAGRPSAEFIHPDDLERMTAIMGAAMESGEPIREAIFRARTKDDRVVFLAANAIPVRDIEGRIILWRGTHRDVTARRRREQALRVALQFVEEKSEELKRSEARFRALMEASPDGILVADILERRFHFANAAICRLLGYPVEDLLRLGVADIHRPEDLPAVTTAFSKVSEGEEVFTEIPFRRRDGSVFLANIKAAQIDLDGRRYVIGIIRDISEQKAMEIKLRASEERFRTLSENLDEFVWECDASLRHTFVSDNVARITGRRPEDLIGRPIHENIVPEERTAFEHQIAGLIEKKTVRGEFEVIVETAGGNQILLAVRAVAHYSPDGSLERITGIGSDVTEQKIMSRLLAQNERRFRELFEVIATCVVIYLPTKDGEDFIIRGFNLAAERTERIGRKEAIEKRITEVFPGVREFGLLDILKRVHRTGIPESHPVSQYRDGRVEGWREYYVFRLETGEIVAAYQDKTVEKRTEEELRRSEERFRRLFTEMQIGFALHEIITDENGKAVDYRYLDVNPAFEAQTGLARDAIIGRTAREVIPGIEDFRVEQYASVALDGESLHFENHLKELKRWFDVVAFSPEPRQFATLLVDVTDRKAGEEMLFKNAKLAALGRITAGMAHELNQPLNAIKSFCQEVILNLRDGVSMPPEEIVESLTYADDQVDRMAEIIQTMKSFASGGGESDQKIVDLNNLASFALLVHKKKHLEYRGGAFTVERSAAPCPVFVNPRRIQQVLINLVMNALDAVEEKKDGPPRIAIRVARSEDGKEGTVEIQDNGPGIPEEIIDRLFEPFFTTKDPDKGTGLGLAISQDIMVKNDGAIECENVPGGGALFRVRLPLVEER